MDHSEGIPLGDVSTTDDDIVQKLIKAQAALDEQTRMAKAYKKDRDLILSEYNDMRHSRAVPKQVSRPRAKAEHRVRVSCGDLHGMMMDNKAVSAFLDDLKILDPDEVILGGDMLECGGWLAKHQTIGFVALCDYTYQEDIKATSKFLDEVQKRAPRAEIHYLAGNHEDRVEKWIVDQTMANKRDAEFLRKAFSPEYVLRLEERGVRYYRRSEIYGEGLPRGWIKRGKMFFTHELGKSRNAAAQSVDKTAGNITFFHTHREDMATRVFPDVGLCKAFNPGCLCTIQPVWQNSNVTNWSQGYAIDFIAKSENFQRVHVPIWRGKSLAGAMVERFKS